MGPEINIVTLVGFIGFLASTIYFQWKGGRSGVLKEAQDTIGLFKSRVESLESAYEETTKRADSLKLQVVALEAVVAEKDKKINDLILIFQGRDDVTTKFQQKVMELIALTPLIIENTEKIMESLETQNSHIEKLTVLIEKHLKILSKR